MSQSNDAEPGFWRTSFRRFVIALCAFFLVRIVGEWFLSGSTAEYLIWLRDNWVSNLVITAIAAAVLGLGEGYEVRKSYWENYGKRDDRYEP